MKKLICIVVLALAGATQDLHAQVSELQSESFFNTPPPGKLPLRATVELKGGNKIIFEYTNLSQADLMPDLDSLIKTIWAALGPFHDSLAKPLLSRRVDYYTTGHDERIRIKEYAQSGSFYSISGSDIVQLKIEQDTLRIKLLTPPPASVRKGASKEPIPYFIMLVINNITDIEFLPAGELNEAASLLQKDILKHVTAKLTHPALQMDARYDLAAQKRIMPEAGVSPATGSAYMLGFYASVGLQYTNGSWAPSGAGGLVLKRAVNTLQWRSLALYFENYFFFARNAVTGKRPLEANSFLTVRYSFSSLSKIDHARLVFTRSFALGYLVARKGEWFDKVTFKITLPGMSFRNASLEPEFVNQYPSLKLNLYIQ